MMEASGNNTSDIFCPFSIDDNLEDRLKDHGISRRNVRSIIHELFSNESVLKLLGTAEEKPEIDFPDAPVTRSKRPRQNSNSEISDLDLSTGSLKPYHEQNENSFLNCDETTVGSIYDINTESRFDDDSEFDWQTWLRGLENNDTDKEKEEEYDSDEDPDFNFLAEAEEFDVEDFRDDYVTRISKKELKSLTSKKKNPKEKKKNTRRPKDQQVVNLPDKENFVTIDDFKRSKTLREKLAMIKQNPELRSMIATNRSKHKKLPKSLRPLIFSLEQKKKLSQQFQQHIQLLTQTCVVEKQNSSIAENMRTFLEEIDFFRINSIVKNASYFNVSSLQEALFIVKYIPTADNHENIEYKMNIIANSNVFMYKELLPEFKTDKDPICKRLKFSYHEDSLITFGVCEMSNKFHMSSSELISRFMLPTRSSKEIRSRIKYAASGRTFKHFSNPIYQYKAFGVLPQSCNKVTEILPNEAVMPLKMSGDLPSWLISLQQRQQISGSTKTNESSYKTCAQNLKRPRSGEKLIQKWTRSMDELILITCKQHDGASKKAINSLANQIPTKTKSQIRKRFYELLSIFSESVQDED